MSEKNVKLYAKYDCTSSSMENIFKFFMLILLMDPNSS